MSHDRYPRSILDASHEGITPTRNDQINVPVQCEEGSYLLSCMYSLDVVRWKRCFAKCIAYSLGQERGSVYGLLATFQYGCVACISGVHEPWIMDIKNQTDQT